MLRGPTVVVLGAGSSVDFGLPTGAGLASDLRSRLYFNFEYGSRLKEGDYAINAFFQEQIRDAREVGNSSQLSDRLYRAARAIADHIGRFSSIDDCLYTHSQNRDMVEVGKLAIARAIAEAEANSFIRGFDGPGDNVKAALDSLAGTWMHRFLIGLCTGIKAEKMEDVFDHLTVVNFNYDRCFDAALCLGLAATFGREVEEVARVMSERFRHIRPYGSLGPLQLPGCPGVPIGARTSSLRDLAAGIKTYTEELGERDDLIQLRDRLAEANSIVFLGFAFHEQNLKLLSLKDKAESESRMVYGTTYGEPTPRREAWAASIRDWLQVASNPRFGGAEDTCAKFLDDWGLAFTT